MTITLHQELDVGIVICHQSESYLFSDRNLSFRKLYYLLFSIAILFLPSLLVEVQNSLPVIRVSWSIPIPQCLLDFGRRCVIFGIWTRQYLSNFRLIESGFQTV